MTLDGYVTFPGECPGLTFYTQEAQQFNVYGSSSLVTL